MTAGTDPRPLRSRILDAATRLLAEHDWSEVTMARIGEAAGVSRQSVYNEVGSKPQLAHLLVGREFDGFMAVVAAELDDRGTLRADVARAARTVLERAADNPVLRAVVSSAHGETSELLPLLTTQAEPLFDEATSVVMERIDGHYTGVTTDPSVLKCSVSAVVRLVFSHVMQPGDRPAVVADDIGWIAERLLRD